MTAEQDCPSYGWSGSSGTGGRKQIPCAPCHPAEEP